MMIYGDRSQIGLFELPIFQRRSKIPTARFTPYAIFLGTHSSYDPHMKARGTHINVRKPHKVTFSNISQQNLGTTLYVGHIGTVLHRKVSQNYQLPRQQPIATRMQP